MSGKLPNRRDIVAASAAATAIGLLPGQLAAAEDSTEARMTFLHGPSTGQSSTPAELASLERAIEWINTPPLQAAALRGKVVLIDFWTYTCVNWLRTLPYVRAWAEKYRDPGLVVIGVHTPEFSFERNVTNVRWAVKDMNITYPVAIDSDYVIWRAFRNNYWPAWPRASIPLPAVRLSCVPASLA
jgi:thiol-disulfide isomerase/thioredoxin